MFLAGVIVGAIVGVSILCLAALLRHHHTWELRQVTHYTKTGNNNWVYTKTLRVCPGCGETKIEDLSGRYELNTLLPNFGGDSDPELDELRKIAGLGTKG